MSSSTVSISASDTDCIVLLKTTDPNRVVPNANFCCNTHQAKCDGSNRITELYLNGTGLQGTFPLAWTRFTQLQVPNLANNSLSGPLLAEIANFTKLVELNISNNTFTEGIPLTGAIPEAVFQPALRVAVFESNQFTSIPSSLGRSKDLQRLSLSNCQLSGEFPKQLLHLLNLERLNLDHNSFIGALPDSISELRSLVELTLNGNDFSGSIPKGLFLIASLNTLNISRNAFTGSISSEIGSLVELNSFDAAENRLEGPIPVEVNKLTLLEEFNVASNKLSGQISRGTFGTQSNMRNLVLKHNQFSAGMPEDIFSLNNMVSLDLSLNQFKGPLSPSVSNLTSLERLSLTANLLYGELPVSLGQMNKLRVFIKSRSQSTCDTFYANVSANSDSNSGPVSRGGSGMLIAAVVGGIVGALVIVTGLLAVLLFLRKKQLENKPGDSNSYRKEKVAYQPPSQQAQPAMHHAMVVSNPPQMQSTPDQVPAFAQTPTAILVQYPGNVPVVQEPGVAAYGYTSAASGFLTTASSSGSSSVIGGVSTMQPAQIDPSAGSSGAPSTSNGDVFPANEKHANLYQPEPTPSWANTAVSEQQSPASGVMSAATPAVDGHVVMMLGERGWKGKTNVTTMGQARR
ncbi:hypothetical protein HDU96_007180 [Phlyctochytrium bullatum]|nr:hypothetical protein HDU96_007180 [Phlyctochytrium bullatum]